MVKRVIRRKRVVKRGKGIGSFFKKVWRGIKKAGSVINDGLKKTKIISTFAPALISNPLIGKTVGTAAGQLGYGRRRRVRRKRVVRGAGVFSGLKNLISKARPTVRKYASRLNTHLKESKWISNELKNRGYSNASKIVSSLGYGRKRVVRRKRTVRKGKGLSSAFNGFMKHAGLPIAGGYMINQLRSGMKRGGGRINRGTLRVNGSMGNSVKGHSSYLKF